METEIVQCPNCGARNRIGIHSDTLHPICGCCRTSLTEKSGKGYVGSLRHDGKFDTLFAVLLLALLGGICYGIVVTPSLLRKDFSALVQDEEQKTKLQKKQHEEKLEVYRTTLEKELAATDAKKLWRNAEEHYNRELDRRKSYDKRFALTPREKAQLRMKTLASDSTKSFHDAIRAVAREASPDGADISVSESFRGIALHIDFDMSSMTAGEQGTRTKHHTKESLRKEVVSLISRVTNDIFQFCKDLDIVSIHVGCRHHVRTEYLPGSTRDENTMLYKIYVQKDRISKATSNLFLDVYSTTKYFEVEEDNFDEIEIVTSII